MNPKNKWNLIIIALAVIAIGLACSGNQKKANALVEEANKSIEEANSLQTTANKKYSEVVEKLNQNFPEGRDEYKAAAQEAADNFGKASTKASDAAGKFDEASKIDTTDMYKKYLTAMANANRKRSEIFAAAKDRAQAIIDSADFDELKGKVDPLTTKITGLEKEAKGFADEADKIKKENANLFEK